MVEKTVRTVADVGPSAITGALGTLGGTALTGPGGPVMGGMTASGTRMAQKAVGAGLEEFRKAKDPSYKGVVDKETPLQAGIDVAGTGLGEFAGAKYAKGFEIRATQAKDFIKNTTIAASSKLTNKTPGTIKSFIENYSEALKLNSEDYRKMYREAITPEGADSPLLSGFEYASKKIGKTGEAEVHSELRNIADSTVTKLENPDFFKPRSNELVKELDVLGNKIAKAETQAKNIKLKHQGIEVERTRLEQRINKNELERLSLERQIGKLRKINSPEAQEKAKLLGEKIDLKAKEAGDLNKEIQLKRIDCLRFQMNLRLEMLN